MFSGSIGYLSLIIFKMILRGTRYNLKFMEIALISIELHKDDVSFSANIFQFL